MRKKETAEICRLEDEVEKHFVEDAMSSVCWMRDRVRYVQKSIESFAVLVIQILVGFCSCVIAQVTKGPQLL